MRTHPAVGTLTLSSREIDLITKGKSYYSTGPLCLDDVTAAPGALRLREYLTDVGPHLVLNRKIQSSAVFLQVLVTDGRVRWVQEDCLWEFMNDGPLRAW